MCGSESGGLLHMQNLFAAIFLAMFWHVAAAQAAAPQKPDWTPLKFLVGHWTADANPQEPGATGSTGFRFDLDGNVLVRENKADYPPQGGKPAQHHRDLMVIYADDSGALKATYWDNEPHTIYYDVSADALGEVSFLTNSAAKGPRFRLTYNRVSDSNVTGRFDIAMPSGNFKPYKTWTMHRD